MPRQASGDTLDHSAYVQLKDMILNKQFESGKLIIQNQLTELLGVSRTPLRKAMAELEMEGYLIRTPKGWYVKEFSLEDMISVFELRAVLEGLACRLAVANLERADFAYMRALFQHAYEELDAKGSGDYYAADKKFHRLIVMKSDNAYVIKTVESFNIIETSLTQGLYRSPHETYLEHMEMISALEAGDGDRAEELMRSHIRGAIDKLKAGIVSGSLEIFR
ncbi:GntR family transcriptional regulator [Paenibacillus soyae]|uniref:GntR family transcriptional regulator n=1 Tax=Paenibacillus soyae TaxID=2969249 RepID=A0A9X2MMR0_9BACL|nr:GntR family transcriptional regulator [Paenibacillus soyae]